MLNEMNLLDGIMPLNQRFLSGWCDALTLAAAKRADPARGQADASWSKWEGEIDHVKRVAPRQLSPTGMVYGLNEHEVKIVEGG